ncbi:MAG: protein TolQ [Halofilum sp. (in: g-proteobacteria)]|nr:protein TolQ [Halofilum sp. (in: g-proteobacteria)]
MSTDLSIIHLVAEASIVVQLVMAILLLASVISWALIYAKWRQLRATRNASGEFEARFWSGGSVAELYRETQADRDSAIGVQRLFTAGFGEYARLHKHGHGPQHVLDGAQRAMRISKSRETDRLDANLSFLATVGSTSPYVGLFGTVWGIMNAFQSLSDVSQATLALVAPGIAEALVATAMGLFAAIPAVIAYNRFSYDMERLETRLDNFVEEFTALLHRQLHARPEQ